MKKEFKYFRLDKLEGFDLIENSETIEEYNENIKTFLTKNYQFLSEIIEYRDNLVESNIQFFKDNLYNAEHKFILRFFVSDMLELYDSATYNLKWDLELYKSHYEPKIQKIKSHPNPILGEIYENIPKTFKFDVIVNYLSKLNISVEDYKKLVTDILDSFPEYFEDVNEYLDGKIKGHCGDCCNLPLSCRLCSIESVLGFDTEYVKWNEDEEVPVIELGYQNEVMLDIVDLYDKSKVLVSLSG